jgi:hypothetical protein
MGKLEKLKIEKISMLVNLVSILKKFQRLTILKRSEKGGGGEGDLKFL